MNPGACILDAFGQRASRTICFGCEAIAYFFILLNYFCADRPVETVEKKVNCLLGVTFR